MSSVAVLVIAKEPLPGRAKTRLCPPCTREQAAALAEAALLDTLDTVSRAPVARRVLVFDGDGERWRPLGFELLQQRGTGLGERLAAAFEDVGGAALLVGMDTPQLTVELIRDGVDALRRPSVDAVLGPALDGGYWTVGLARPAPGLFDGVPMSDPATCAVQRKRIQDLGLRLHEHVRLRDVDTIDDARAVALEAPASRFAAAVAAL
jgi:rSAM/selenodomain-associated transferase 1